MELIAKKMLSLSVGVLILLFSMELKAQVFFTSPTVLKAAQDNTPELNCTNPYFETIDGITIRTNQHADFVWFAQAGTCIPGPDDDIDSPDPLTFTFTEAVYVSGINLTGNSRTWTITPSSGQAITHEGSGVIALNFDQVTSFSVASSSTDPFDYSQVTVHLPLVATNAPSNVSGDGASLSGEVSSDGGANILERGFLISVTSINSNPRLGDDDLVRTLTLNPAGFFNAGPDELDSKVQYSFVAYAKNSVGVGYGEVKTFTTNNKPTFTSDPITAVDDDATYNYTVITSDADNDPVTVTATEKPDWLSFNGTLLTGSAVGQTGNHTVTLEADDGNGGTATQAFTITVNDATAPVFENSTPSTARNIASTSITLNTDIDEAGTIYYVVLADEATAPTSTEVRAGTGSGGTGQVTSGNATALPPTFSRDFSLTSLTENTAYDVYVVAQDDESTPNLQASPTLVNVTTLAPLEVAIEISSSVSSTGGGSDGSMAASITGGLSPYTYFWSNGATTLMINELVAGSYTIFVTDANDTQVQATVTLTVSDPPTFTSTATTSVKEDVTYLYEIEASDPDEDELTFTAPTLPSWLTLNDNAAAVSTFAGTLSGGSYADGTGAAARFNFPTGTAIDGSGNVYVADQGNHRIRKINPAGVVTTLAGSSQGFSEGTGSAAQFNVPYGVAVDGSGNVYVADALNHRIRKVSPAGVVTTFVGSGTAGFADGTGAAAQFNFPQGVAIDASDNLYVADANNHRIRKITPAGEVTTLAGSGTSGFTEGTGVAAQFDSPIGLTVDAAGNVYVADHNNHSIRKITSIGVVTTLAGSGDSGFAEGTGTAAQFNLPIGVTLDALGNVYVGDFGNNRIRKITPAGVVTTFAGSTFGFADGIGSAAQFRSPAGLAIDASGIMYVAGANSTGIRKIELKELVIGTPTSTDIGAHNVTLQVADGKGGTDQQSFVVTVNAVVPPVFENGTPSAAAITTTDFTLNADIDKAGAIYYVVVVDGASVPTSAEVKAGTGNGGSDAIADGNAVVNSGDFTTAFNISGLESGTAYDVYVVAEDDKADPDLQEDPTKIEVSTLNNAPTFTSTAVTSAEVGNLYNYELAASDLDGDALTYSGVTLPSWMTIATPSVSTFAGGDSGFGDGPIDGPEGGFGDGPEDDFIDGPDDFPEDGPPEGGPGFKRLGEPAGIALDAAGNLYVADIQNHSILKISPMGEIIPLAGNGSAGSADGTGSEAQFNYPYAVAVDGSGNVYVADSENHSIRKITQAGVVTTLAGNGTLGFADGTGSDAQFGYPYGVAVDAMGNLFVGDYDNHSIRKITPDGVVTTLAGSGTSGFTDGTGSAAQFNGPSGLTVDASGNIFVADYENHSIRKITPAGVVTTLAGSGSQGFRDGVGGTAQFSNPESTALDALGNLFVTDYGNNSVRKITPEGVVTTFAGQGYPGSEDGSFSIAEFDSPIGIAIDVSGNIFVGDSGNGSIRKITQKTSLTGTPTTEEIGAHSVVLQVSDGKGGTEKQSFTVTVSEAAPPVITSTTTAGFTENGTGTVYTAEATDASTLIYSLGTGNDEALFDIVGTSGVVTFKVAPDFENPLDGDANNTYVINVIASDGINSANQDVTITVRDLDEIAPVLTSSDAVDFVENGTETAYTVTASDAGALSYRLGSGNDESRFRINTSTGVVTFRVVPDFEDPTDEDSNNTYVINVIASDGTNSVDQVVTITITDVDDTAPVFISEIAADFVEKGTATAYIAMATDANTISYSLGAGNDEALFDIVAASGLVTFKVAPDFEAPADADANNTYVINVVASDGINSSNQNVTITVTDVDDVDPVLTSVSAKNFLENGTGPAYTIAATDAGNLTYSLGSGNDETLFDVDPTSGVVSFITAPDFENPTDSDADNVYVISVMASDGLNTASQNVIITVINIDDTAPVLTSSNAVDYAENSTSAAYTVTATDANLVTYSMGIGNDEVQFDIDAASGVVTFIATPDFENPTDSDVNSTYVINVMASDGINSVDQTVTITIIDVNEAPSFETLEISTAGENGAQVVSGFAFNINDGDGLAEQALVFNVSNDNNDLFIVQPSVDLVTGDLSYTLGDNVSGSALITVSLSDDGGTANGGIDTSESEEFMIEVNTVTAIENDHEFNDGNISIYPNPVSSVLNIDLSSLKSNDVSATITNLAGVRYFFTENIASSSVSVNVRSYSSGIYILLLETEGSMISQKFIIK